MPPHACAVRGLSLVEMLVVVAIIVALASMLVPVITNLRNSAQATKCMAHMRQCAAAHVSYAQDERGQLPPTQVYLASNGTTYLPWSVFIASYLERDVKMGSYINSTQLVNLPLVSRCPSKQTNPAFTSDNVVGMARNPQLAYETNASAKDYTTGLVGAGAGWPSTIFRLAAVSMPVQRVLLADWHSTTYLQLDAGQNAWQEMTSAGVPTAYKGPTRHGGRGNYVFVDGHGGRFAPDSGIFWGMRDPAKFTL